MAKFNCPLVSALFWVLPTFVVFWSWDFQGMETPQVCFLGVRVYLEWQDAKGRHLMPRKTSLCPNSSCNAGHWPGDRLFTALMCVLQTQWLVRLSRVLCANFVGEQVLWHHVFVGKSCKGFLFCLEQGDWKVLTKSSIVCCGLSPPALRSWSVQ